MAEKSRGSQHKARAKLRKDSGKKITVNEQLKDFEEGDKARIQISASKTEGRPHARFHGKVGTITGKRGDGYEIKFKDGNTEKTLHLKPVHLQKMEG